MEHYKRGTDWHVRRPDGSHLNMNSREAAEEILGLWEYIDSLEHQLKRRRGRRKKTTEEEILQEITD